MLESRVAVGTCVLVIFLIFSNTSASSSVATAKFKHYLGVLHSCLQETEVTLDTYAYTTPNNSSTLEFERVKCVDLCMFNKLRIMKPNGDIDMAKALEHLLSGKPGVQRDNMRRYIETCDTSNLSNKCDVAHALMTCALGHY